MLDVVPPGGQVSKYVDSCRKNETCHCVCIVVRHVCLCLRKFAVFVLFGAFCDILTTSRVHTTQLLFAILQFDFFAF